MTSAKSDKQVARSGGKAFDNLAARIRTEHEATAIEWAGKIRIAWQKSVEAILETGALIIKAKDDLPHGAFLQMVEGELPFGPRTAQLLMQIASDKRLTNAKSISLLPASWSILSTLSRLDDGTFQAAIESRRIYPDMTGPEARTLLLGLNAIGKLHSENFDPNYRMKYHPPKYVNGRRGVWGFSTPGQFDVELTGGEGVMLGADAEETLGHEAVSRQQAALEKGRRDIKEDAAEQALVARLCLFARETVRYLQAGHLKIGGDPEHVAKWNDLRNSVEALLDAGNQAPAEVAS
jgi:hypothetical protein